MNTGCKNFEHKSLWIRALKGHNKLLRKYLRRKNRQLLKMGKTPIDYKVGVFFGDQPGW